MLRSLSLHGAARNLRTFDVMEGRPEAMMSEMGATTECIDTGASPMGNGLCVRVQTAHIEKAESPATAHILVRSVGEPCATTGACECRPALEVGCWLACAAYGE